MFFRHRGEMGGLGDLSSCKAAGILANKRRQHLGEVFVDRRVGYG